MSKFSGLLLISFVLILISPVIVSQPRLSGVQAITGGHEHSCAIQSDASIQCWGNGDNNRLVPPTGDFTVPSGNLNRLTAGDRHSCAIKSDNTIACWGHASSHNKTTPPAGMFKEVSAGENHTCAIRRDGGNANNNNRLVCWGAPGEGSGDNRLNPPNGAFRNLAIGAAFGCAIEIEDNSLDCWGNQRPIEGADGPFRSVTAGRNAVCAVRLSTNANNDYRVRCWGIAEPDENARFHQLAAGDAHVCGLTFNASTIQCWGDSAEGKTTPPAGIFTSIEAGTNHTCAIRNDGRHFCWGRNTDGQVKPRVTAFTISSPAVTEGGSITATVNLSYPALSTLNLSLAVSGSGSSDDFTPVNINVPQGSMTVNIPLTITDDNIVEGGESITLNMMNNSWDAEVSGVSPVTLSITDNDNPGITVNRPNPITATEGGTNATYTIALQKRPRSGQVTVRIQASQQCLINDTTSQDFAFTDTTPRTITVKAVDDLDVEGSHSCNVTQAIVPELTEGLWHGVTLENNFNVNIVDLDVGSIVLDEIDGTVISEGDSTGGSDTYTVRLATFPLNNVVVNVDPTAACRLDNGVNDAAKTIILSKNNPTHQLTVRVDGDNIVGASPAMCTITHTIDSGLSDSAWATVTIDTLTVTINDDDLAAVHVTDNGGIQVTEGGAAGTYTLSISDFPRNNENVAVDIAAGAECQVTSDDALNPIILNASKPSISINVSALNDEVVETKAPSTEACIITHMINAAGSESLWDTVSINGATVQISDDDIPGLTATSADGPINLVEGGIGDTYILALDKLPLTDVVVVVTPDTQCNIGAGQADPLSFTLNSAIPELTINLTSWDDDLIEGQHECTVTHTIDIPNSDTLWDSVSINQFKATLADNDVPHIKVIETNDTTVITEGGNSDTYTLSLGSHPQGDVVVIVTPDSQCSVGAGVGQPRSLTFNSVSPHSVTVSAHNDTAVEGSHTCVITHTIDQAATHHLWDAISIPGVIANVVDNELSEVSLVETEGKTNVVEGGRTDTYSIVLNMAPAGNVTIIADPDTQCNVGGGAGFPVSLNFNAGTLSQSLLVIAADDAFPEPEQQCVISHTIDRINTHDSWDNVFIPNLTVIVRDGGVEAAILTNADFENGLASWKLKNKSQDKVKCNSQNPSGNGSPCAFMFKGRAGENTKLEQIVSAAHILPDASITLDIDYRTNNAKPRLKVKLTMIYADGFTESVKGTLNQTSQTYSTFSLDSYTVQTGRTLASVKLRLTNKGTKGKLYLDNINLMHRQTIPR